jgi:hypothetical protein
MEMRQDLKVLTIDEPHGERKERHQLYLLQEHDLASMQQVLSQRTES